MALSGVISDVIDGLVDGEAAGILQGGCAGHA